MTVSYCGKCQHWLGKGTCSAFPEGIPMPLLSNTVTHDRPYPGDNGFLFVPLVK